MFFPIYSFHLDCLLLQTNRGDPQSEVAVIRKKHRKSKKIKKSLDYLGVFIDIFLVSGQNSCSLAKT